jgi:hypothetical protein
MLSWEKDAFYAKQIHTQLKVRASFFGVILDHIHARPVFFQGGASTLSSTTYALFA